MSSGKSERLNFKTSWSLLIGNEATVGSGTTVGPTGAGTNFSTFIVASWVVAGE